MHARDADGYVVIDVNAPLLPRESSVRPPHVSERPNHLERVARELRALAPNLQHECDVICKLINKPSTLDPERDALINIYRKLATLRALQHSIACGAKEA